MAPDSRKGRPVSGLSEKQISADRPSANGTPEHLSEPPAAPEAESVLLGSFMLLKGSEAITALTGLVVDDFSTEANRITFQAITALLTRGESADPVCVLAELQHAGRVSSWPTPAASVGNFLHDCVAVVPVPLSYLPAYRAVLEASARRRVHQAALRLCQASGSASFDGLADVVTRETGKLTDAMSRSVAA